MGGCMGKAAQKQVKTTRVPQRPLRVQSEQQVRSFNCPYCGLELQSTQGRVNCFTQHILQCQERVQVQPRQRIKTQKTPQLPPKNLKRKPYEKKIKWFRKQMLRIRVPWQQEYMQLNISRDKLFEQSYEHIMVYLPEDMRKEFQINFSGEIAQDAGGLTREWITLLINEIFSEKKGLLTKTNTKCMAYIFPPKISEERLPEYEFFGRVVAKALFDGVAINCPLSRIIYKYLVDDIVDIDDLNFLDEDLFKSLNFMKDNSIEDVFFETFTVTKDYLGSQYEFNIKDDDSQVNEENKLEYITLRSNFELYEIFKDALWNFKQGFYSVVPSFQVQIFDADELEFAICGLPYIDQEDWRLNTVYRSCSPTDQAVLWFWEILSEMQQDSLSLLLTYITGSPRLPVEGFKNLKSMRGESCHFTIEVIPYHIIQYPRAHTCFNRLDLPQSPSKEDLQQKLEYVLTNHASGFGMEQCVIKMGCCKICNTQQGQQSEESLQQISLPLLATASVSVQSPSACLQKIVTLRKQIKEAQMGQTLFVVEELPSSYEQSNQQSESNMNYSEEGISSQEVSNGS